MNRPPIETGDARTTLLLPGFVLPQNTTLQHRHPTKHLFTADTKSIYTNIHTGPAVQHISNLLCSKAVRTFQQYNVQALTEALQIVFQNNILQFGVTYWKQILGKGMGIAPAPQWATIYFAIHKNHVLPQWNSNILFYPQFINDIIGIWTCDECPECNRALWTQFQDHMQQWHRLEWEFSPISQSCNYMDLTLTISSQTIQSTLHEKAQNLYLYLPPLSSHPRGPLQSLIFGNILQIHRLCSTPQETIKNTHAFHRLLTNRGHPSATITALFQKVTQNALEFMSLTPDDHATHQQMLKEKTENTIFLHLQYHPQDPPARDQQHVWQQTIATPHRKAPIAQMKNIDGVHIPIHSLTIAYIAVLQI
eukprot:CCRYP_016814-RA/>CCRYP_016814-RA protein AED:0.34 eAED:-0.04 QI:0/-1/0/1/-1/0/1/0/363